MEWDWLTGQQMILGLLIFGFLFLAALCLSERAFTQLLGLLARRGYKVAVTKRGSRRRRTSSSTGTVRGTKSRAKVDDHTTSG
jgi:hypothetical protein